MNNYQKQSGVVLLVSLIMLLLLTIIAITAASQSTLQQRMAANAQQQNNAFQAAESGIQNWIEGFKKAPDAFSTNVVSWNTGAGTARYTAAAPAANNCVGVIPAISLNADESNSTFQYGCYEIESTGQSCPDANCNPNDNPATSTHIQGYLVRY